MLLLRRCYNRITPLSLTNCALLAWTVSESVKGWTQPNRSPALALSLSSHLLVRRALASGASSASAPTTQDCPASQPRGMRVEVAQVPCLQDNYGYLLHDPVSGQTASIDTPDARALTSELERRGWTLTHIWNTHHHWDHTGGNRELKAAHPGLQVIGPAGEQSKIPGIDVPVGEGDAVSIGSIEARVIDVGGHTRGHIAYHLPSEKVVFVGDALFSLGCGRMFEGTPRQFWASLQRLRSLPDDTAVYCAHEYTLSNGKFALSVEPSNEELARRFREVEAARGRGEPTVPTLLGLEKRTNPFLRVDVSEEIRRNVGAGDGDADDEVFGKVRRAKDNFRG